MEIEAKYRVAPEDLERAAGLRALGPYTLTPAPEPERQENRYYDTADRRLEAARHGLRVRRIGERALITLKGPAEQLPGGGQRRVEHEFPGDNPDPATWPAGPARDLGTALVGGAQLDPTVAVSTERRILHVHRGDVAVAELCLDRGTLRGGGRERPFTELEIELLPGGAEPDLAALAAALATHIALAPEPQSKLQRALGLQAEAPAARRRRPPMIDVGTILETYRVDVAHARRVADHALSLFDAVAARFQLRAEGRPLLEVAALLHNVGLTTDPPAHHIVGRDIVLGHAIGGLDATEQALVAALVAFHRKRVRAGGEPAYLSLGRRRRKEALALAAILRVADGLDYSQSQTTALEEVAEGPAGLSLRLSGPHAGADGLRAVAKADLWAKRFGEALAAEGPGGEPLPMPPEAEAEAEGESGDALLAPWYASPQAPLAELGRVLLRRHLRRMLSAARAVQADRGIEPVHELRVATRRMRAMLRILAPLGPGSLRAHGRALGRLARAAGAVRDRDVLLADLRGRAAELPETLRPGADGLLAALEAERRAAHGQLLRALDAAEHAAFLRAFAAAICRRDGWDDGPQVRDLAGSIVWRHYEALRSHARGGLPADDEALHVMRIEAKRLRYVLELFAETCGPRADEAVASLAAFQDHLGALNDVAVARQLVDSHLADDERGAAAAAYLALRERQLDELRAELPARWEMLDGDTYRRKLMELIVQL